jgi:catechol 2,3-dioxygenase-like lactoylglutathione lyase family enzyme
MFFVPDMRATVRWYESIGFTVRKQFEEDGELVFAELCFGNGEFALSPGGDPGPRDVRLWFFTDQVEELYKYFTELRPAVQFDEVLYDPFYGGRQFSILDINGLSLIFWQPGIDILRARDG